MAEDARERSGVGTKTALSTQLALSILGVLLMVPWVAALFPLVRAGTTAYVLTVAFGAAVIATYFVVRLFQNPPTRATAKGALYALVAPLIVAITLGVSMFRSNGAPSWALRGDMIWNTAQSGFVYRDGGVLTELHPNPAPLTNEIFAAFYGFDDSLGNVFLAHALAITALLVLLSLIGGLYVARVTDGLNSFVQFCLVFAAGWIPCTGLVLSGVFELGHANVLTSLLALWVAWIVYAAKELGFWLRAAGVVASMTVVLASWAPLVAIPVALLAVILWQHRGGKLIRKPPSARTLIIVSFSVVQLVLYVMLVTVPDFRRSSGALASNGAAGGLSIGSAAVFAVTVFLVALIVAIIQFNSRAYRDIGIGMLAIFAISVPVLGYLFAQRGSEFWGYYPIKYTLIALTLLLGISIAAIGSVCHRTPNVLAQILIGAIGIPVVLVALAVQPGPIYGTIAPTLKEAIRIPIPHELQAIQDLIHLQNIDEDTSVSIVVDWNETTGIEGTTADGLVNAYLLQLTADRSSDPIRHFAYFLDTSDSDQLCELITTAEQDFLILTREEPEQFRIDRLSGCPAADQVLVLNSIPGN